ncbi:MAG: hypothetical protein ACTSSI_11740 [Candidatus Helarchaeota archaeon]
MSDYYVKFWERRVIPDLKKWNSGVSWCAVEIQSHAILDTHRGALIFNSGDTLSMPRGLVQPWMRILSN